MRSSASALGGQAAVPSVPPETAHGASSGMGKNLQPQPAQPVPLKPLHCFHSVLDIEMPIQAILTDKEVFFGVPICMGNTTCTLTKEFLTSELPLIEKIQSNVALNFGVQKGGWQPIITNTLS